MASRRKCKKCDVIKEVTQFGKLSHGRNGLRSQCLDCDKKYQREYRSARAKTPKEDEEYLLNNETMRNHFYIHFGFTIHDKENWRYDYTKYYEKPLVDKLNALKRNK
jgi:hypothetical protein